jgi:FAD dependent oxidoreductase
MSQSESYNLVVYGGTPGGIACAVRCAREGLTVALVNCSQHLGGMLAAGLGLFDTSYEGNRAPLVQEVFAAIVRHYEEKYGRDSENVRLCRKYQTFEPHVAELVLTRLVAAEKNITVFKGWHVVHTERAGRTLHAVGLRAFEGGGALRLAGVAFIDASYEGDLAATAGVPCRVGRESRAEFGEPHAGRIFTRYEEQSEEIKKYPYAAAHGYIRLKPFDLSTGRIFPGSTGEGDRAIMAYNFRLALSRDPANQVPVPKPENYRRDDYVGLLLPENESFGTPYPLKSKWLLDDVRHFKFRNHRQIPNHKLSWNHGNFPGRNHAYPEAGWPERRKISQEHKDHELGLLWFLQNDPEVPAEVRQRARELGLARDEFTDNGHFPWEFYVREARRIVGRAVFTELDGSIAPGLRRSPPHADSIAITEWMMDSHECNTERQPGSAYEGAVLLSELTRPGHVPYRCLLPQGLDNLLVPVCLSATHIGWGTIRVEPTWIHIAESAAHACVLAAQHGIAPALVSVPELQRRLVERRLMIAFFNDHDMSTGAAWVSAVQYFAPRGFFADYDAEPGRPVGRSLALVWSAFCAAEAAGTADANAAALAVTALAAPAAEPVSAPEFAALLASQWSCRLAARLDPDGLLLPGADLKGPLTRGDACRMMLTALSGRCGECGP